MVKGKWQAFSPAFFDNYLDNLTQMRQEASPLLIKFAELLDSVRENDAKKVNTFAAEYIALVKDQPQVENEIRAIPTKLG